MHNQLIIFFVDKKTRKKIKLTSTTIFILLGCASRILLFCFFFFGVLQTNSGQDWMHTGHHYFYHQQMHSTPSPFFIVKFSLFPLHLFHSLLQILQQFVCQFWFHAADYFILYIFFLHKCFEIISKMFISRAPFVFSCFSTI